MAIINAKLSDNLLNALNDEESKLHKSVFANHFFENIAKERIRVISSCKDTDNKDDKEIFSKNLGYDVGCIYSLKNIESNVLSYFDSYEKYKENINLYGKNIYATISVGDNFDGLNFNEYDFYVDYFTYNTYFCVSGDETTKGDKNDPLLIGINGVVITCKKKEIKPDKDVINLLSLLPGSSKLPTKDMMLNGIRNGELWEKVNPSFMQQMINNAELIDAWMINRFLSVKDFNQSCDHMDTLSKTSGYYKIYYTATSYNFDNIIMLSKGADSYWIFWLDKEEDYKGTYSVLRITKDSFNKNDDEAERTFEKYIKYSYPHNLLYHVNVKSFGGYITL